MLNPFVAHPAYRFFAQFPHLHVHGEPETAPAPDQSSWTPAVDIYETQDAFQLVFEVPGVVPADLDLKVEKDILTVTGQKGLGFEAEGAQVLRTERQVGKFTRTFNLPRDIDSTHIQAKFDSGVLRVTLPKQAESKPRKIEIAGA